MGNASGPKMENVRIIPPNHDIDTFTDSNGMVWVKAATGGVSTWEAPVTGLKGKSWEIPAGTPYSDELRVWSDQAGHWSWEPMRDMSLSQFTRLLADVNGHAK